MCQSMCSSWFFFHFEMRPTDQPLVTMLVLGTTIGYKAMSPCTFINHAGAFLSSRDGAYICKPLWSQGQTAHVKTMMKESAEGNNSISSSSHLPLANLIPFNYMSNNARSPSGHLNDIQGNARPESFLKDLRTAWGQPTDVA